MISRFGYSNVDSSRNYKSAGGYTLILDEVMSVVEKFKIEKKDVRIFYKSGILSVDENEFVVWNDEEYSYYEDDTKEGLFVEYDRLVKQKLQKNTYNYF